jgi:hypothetical protein
MRASIERRGRPPRTAGRIPLWLSLAFAVTGAFLVAERIAATPAARALVTVDTCRARLVPGAPGEHTGDQWVDERWSRELSAALAAVDPFPVDDAEGAEELARQIGALPFVAEVGTPRALWPDGVEVPVRLRRPAACVLSGDGFLSVAEDGTLLPGGFPAPPWIGAGYLPVIGPNDGAFDAARPGERLVEARHLDALSVAISMRAALDQEVFETMGPPLIDATRAREASVEEPGVRIDLEGARRVLFGRAPSCAAPGELPAALKWRSLARAVRELRHGDRDWDRLDVRWDEPVMRVRERPARDPLGGVGGV